MTKASAVVLALMATTAFIHPVFAANDLAKAPHETAAQQTADKDFGMLSKDGADAFRDLHLTRLAIFQADPKQAKTTIASAQAALGKAKTDESVFTKAESELHAPGPTKTDAKAATNGSQQTNATTSPGQKITWLPIDGQLTLAEDFKPTPEKAGAISDANKHLTAGDRKGAVETLKLAGINVDMTVAVLPLDQTVSDVNNAASLIDQGKYYEANAVLKGTEDRMRFDIVDASTLPQKAASTPKTDAVPPNSGAAKTAK